ncbi:MAG: PAS domain S-box protein [Thermodesulfobacteriota bacterium]
MTAQHHAVPWHRSLRFKLVAAAITIELVMLSALLANSFRLLNNAVVSQTQSRLESIPPLLDAALAGRVFQRDHAEMEAILHRLTTNQLTEISYICILDPGGNVVASSGTHDANHDGIHDPIGKPVEDHNVDEALRDLTYDSSLPLTILGNEVGSVHFGLSLTSMVTTQNLVVRDGLIIAALEIILSLLLLASGGYLITRHIGSLTEGTRRVAQGDYNARIHVSGDDEISVLANDFNTMAAAIASHINELRASEMRFQAIFNAVGEAIFIHDIDTGAILDVNQAMRDMFGCSHEEALANDMSTFSAGVPPYTLDGAIAKIQAAVAGTPQQFDWHARTLDGRRFWIEVSLRLAKIGEDKRVIAVVRDISERKKNEEHIARLATAIEQAAEDIIITDARGVIQYVNPAQTTTTGYHTTELLGHDLSIFNTPGKDNPADREMWQAIRAGRKWQGRLHTRAKGGLVLIQETIVAPILDSAGSTAGYVMTRRDVTRQVETEKLLAQSQKMEAIGTLAGGIAHDFNNILSAIVGYTELARLRAGNGDKQQEYLAHIHDASMRARDLVQQILAFSRKATQQMAPLQISSIVKEALKLLRATIPATIEIRQEITTEASVLADATQIHQVVMNLCTNAYQAMWESGGTLGISVREVTPSSETLGRPLDDLPTPGGRHVLIEVSDTGCGMDQETLKKIFDPYFTTKELGRGTGLGLAVVHGIVKSHKGRISVYSEKGKGSTFRVLLPVVESGTSSLHEETREIAALSGCNERVMFVDDEEQIRTMAREYLTSFGYRVDVFSDGASALTKLTQDPQYYDLLVTDMAMPDMDGKALAQQAMTLRPDLPVILCTGYSALINAESARAMGIREYVQKPVVMADLLEHMKKALSR